MTRLTSSLLIIILTALAANTAAEIHAELQVEVTLPDSVNVGTAIEVMDINSDGYAELLFRDANPIVSYSMSENRVIDCFRRASDDLRRVYKAEFIDGDDRLDVAEAVLIPSDTGDTFAIVVRYGGDLYLTPDTVYAASGLDTSRTYTIDKLYFADADRDGHKELYAQYYYTVVVWDDPWSSEPSTYYHYSPVAYSFEGGSISVPGTLPPDISPFYVAADSSQSVATVSAVSVYSYTPYGHGHGATRTGTFRIYTELAAGGSSTHYFGTGVTCDYEWNSGNDYDRYVSLSAAAAGDLLPNRPGLELLLLIDHEFGAAGYWGYCYNEALQLLLLNLDDPVGWDTVLNVMPFEGTSIDRLFVDERFEGSFFSLGDGIIRLHDALTLEVMDLSVAPIAGSWVGYERLRTDQPPLAVFRNGRTFRFYALVMLPTEVEEDVTLPEKFTLGQPYPNPFNPTVTIPLTVGRKGRLCVEIFNPLGQRVATLQDGVASPGETVLSWDASDFGSGVYLIKATLGAETQTVKAVLVK